MSAVAIGMPLPLSKTSKLRSQDSKPWGEWKGSFSGIFARLGNDGRNERTRDLDVPQLDWLIETFRGLFPNQHRPDGLTRGDTNGWDAAEFLTSLIRRLGSQTSDAAIAAMSRLRDGPLDGYTAGLRAVAAEQRRNRVEADYRAPAFAYVVSAIGDAPPTTRRQLQAVVLEELRIVQAKLRGSDVDWYADFIDDAGRPRIEDHCRNAVLKMLRPMPFDIQALPEGHIADDKRCDIICLLGNLMVPIEVKGQWNVDLWSAADHQLASLYINDWRAEVGIYLVLWFGSRTTKSLRKPPRNIDLPNRPVELRESLETLSNAAREGRLAVVVLDLTRPNS